MDNIFEKLTHNMTEAIESSVSLALHNKNMEVDPVHFLWALLTNSNSALNQALNKMNIDKTAIELDVRSMAEKLPTSSSVTKESIRLSKKFADSLQRGAAQMTKNGDSFLAVDSYLIGNIDEVPFKDILVNMWTLWNLLRLMNHFAVVKR